GLSYGNQIAMVKNMAQQVLADNGIKDIALNEENTLAAGNGFTAKLNAKQLAALKNDSRIAFIEEDRLVNPAMSDKTSSTIVTKQQTSWGVTKVGGAGNGVGKTAWIIDSGIDPYHKDLTVDKTRSKSFLTST